MMKKIIPYLNFFVELAFPSTLSYLLLEYNNVKQIYESDIVNSFCTLFYVLFLIEMLRRVKSGTKPEISNYLYIIVSLVIFYFGILILKSFE